MTTINNPIEGILFDSDGVLVDSFDAAAIAWDSWAAMYAPEFDFRTQIRHGVRVSEMVATLVSPDELVDALLDLNRRETASASASAPIPGAVALTTSLPPHRWAVVTSATRQIAHLRLAASGHPLPHALVAAEDVERGKPEPQPYLLGAKMLGLDPSHCVVFEDAPAGVRAARAAGVGLIIGVGDHLDGAETDLIIADLRSAQFDNERLVVNGRDTALLSSAPIDSAGFTITETPECATCNHDPHEHAGTCRADVYRGRAWTKCACTRYLPSPTSHIHS